MKELKDKPLERSVIGGEKKFRTVDVGKPMRNDVVYIVFAASSVPSILDVGIPFTQFCHGLSVKLKGLEPRLRNDARTRVSVNGKNLCFGPEHAQATNEASLDKVVKHITFWKPN